MSNKNKILKQGFTLVELSIVIIIIGFLISGISAGQSLIKQASLTSVVTDFNNYKLAYTTFIGRYNQKPGDMNNAYSYWGANCADSDVNCNGDGNGIIQPTTTIEPIKAMRHLYLAGLINFNGTVLTSSLPDFGNGVIVGETVPPSRANSKAGYIIHTGQGYVLGHQSVGFLGWDTDYVLWKDADTDAVILGVPGTYNPDFSTTLGNPGLTAKDGFNLDQKIDDGSIDASGNMIGAASGQLRNTDGWVDAYVGDCLTVSGGEGNWFNPGNSNPHYYNSTSTSVACVTMMQLN